jgi:hypothetical protein
LLTEDLIEEISLVTRPMLFFSRLLFIEKAGGGRSVGAS